ncbi:MAG: carboxypeptidase-like regulatory domain-containing protein [Flavobacteriaceae bacterium]
MKNITSSSSTCGKFYESQLKIYTRNPHKRKKYSFLRALSFAFLSLFTLNTIQSQQTIKSKKVAKQIKKRFTVKGVVKDETGSLPGVSILLQGTTKGTETDFDGKFTFPVSLKKGDVLIFSYLGYKTEKVTIDGKNSNPNLILKLNVNFETASCVLMGAVEVKKVFKSKKKS